MYLLDSNLISELRSAKRCHPQVRAWEEKTPTRACFLSAVTIMEIRQGIESIRRKDPGFSQVLGVWLEVRVKPVFAKRILKVSASVAERAGVIAAQQTRGLADCLIASTALEYGLLLVTRNVSDFEDIEGLKVVNPWDE